MAGTVIVVGAGLAGLSAAHTALENGANVVLVERNLFMGGNSTKATSGMNGAGTKTQKAMNVPDSAEKFFEDTVRGATGLYTGPWEQGKYGLGNVLTANSGAAVHWVQDRFGLALDTVSRLGGHSFPRTHRSKNGTTFPGMEITFALMKRYEELSVSDPKRVQLITKARVHKLLNDAQGRVSGVVYKKDGVDVEVKGDAVVISTGGYGAGGLEKGSLLEQIRPDLCNLPTTNGNHCTGDGIQIAMSVGAGSIDLKHVQVHPTGLVHMDDPNNRSKFLAAEALRGEGALILDRDGKRFANDLGTRDYVTMRMWQHNKPPYRLILNKAGYSNIAWHCKHYCGRRVMKEYKHGSELANDIGIPLAELEAEFNRYNAIAEAKNDPWGKKFFPAGPWGVNDSFMVAIVTPVVHYAMGGLEISPAAECLDAKTGLTKPGLFAAGEATGGVHGRNRLGGSALLECVVFGRVAGATATTWIKEGRSANPKKVERAIPLPDSQVSTIPPPHIAGKGVPEEEKGAAGAQGAGKLAKGDYSLEEVAKHNKDTDCWVVVNGKVLDVTGFLDDHPGGKMAIMTFAGRDATEEFNMVHEEGTLEKYAKEFILGNVKPKAKL